MISRDDLHQETLTSILQTHFVLSAQAFPGWLVRELIMHDDTQKTQGNVHNWTAHMRALLKKEKLYQFTSQDVPSLPTGAAALLVTSLARG
jgi:hypothetical protein